MLLVYLFYLIPLKNRFNIGEDEGIEGKLHTSSKKYQISAAYLLFRAI